LPFQGKPVCAEAEYAAPTGLGIFLGPVFYKYVAPTALGSEFSGCSRLSIRLR